MDQPGVEVRPIKNIVGQSMFNEVFFTDARTAADNVVGEVNAGWSVAMTLLGFERGTSVTTDAIRFKLRSTGSSSWRKNEVRLTTRISVSSSLGAMVASRLCGVVGIRR